MEFECAQHSETVEARRGAASSHGHAQVNAMSQWVSSEILSTLMSTENNMVEHKGRQTTGIVLFPDCCRPRRVSSTLLAALSTTW
jgi:hypothetical protein